MKDSQKHTETVQTFLRIRRFQVQLLTDAPVLPPQPIHRTRVVRFRPTLPTKSQARKLAIVLPIELPMVLWKSLENHTSQV
jgi:hypothetical protein